MDSTQSSKEADEDMQKLKQVLNSIEKTTGLIDQLYHTVTHFTPAIQMPFLQCINGIAVELGNMVKLSENNCKIQVHAEDVNLIDNGKNPDEFAKDVLDNIVVKNQMSKGKTEAFKDFRMNLLKELGHNFPEKIESFRQSREASASEFKPLAEAQR